MFSPIHPSPIGRLVGWLSEALRGAGDGDHDASLVRSAQRGGRAGRRAFGTLVERHQAWMVRLLVSLLGARGEAEDVAQEAFTKAYLGLARYRNDGPIRAWLRVIATREAFNARRKTRERVLDDPDRRPDVGAPDPGFDGLMARDTVLTVLERMPYAWREALVLRHVEEMEIGELAALWETSPAAVKMRLTRARQRFAEIHAGLDGEPDGALAR